MNQVKAGVVTLLETGIYEYMDNQTAPEEGARLRRHLASDSGKVTEVIGRHFDVVYPGPVANKEDALRAAERFRKEGVQLLLVVSLFWSGDKALLALLRALPGIPILYWCYTPEPALPDHMGMADLYRRSGAVGAMQNSAPLKKMGVDFGFLFGSPADAQLNRDIADYARAYEVLFALNGLKIGQVGGRYEDMTGTYVDEFLLLSRFGIDLVHITPSMVMDAAKEIPNGDVEDYIRALKSQYPVRGVTDEGLYRAARVSMATVKAAVDRGVCALAVEDFNAEIRRTFQTRPHLWVPGLRERGMVVAMESDAISALCLWISRHLGETTPMYTEIFTFDTERNALLMGHAAMLDPQLAKAGSGVLIRDAEMDGIDESEGAWLHFRGRTGPVVVNSLFGAGGDYTAAMFQGESIENEVLDIHPNILVRMRQPLREVFEALMRRGMTQHYAVSYDDISARWRKFCEIAHIDLMEIR